MSKRKKKINWDKVKNISTPFQFMVLKRVSKIPKGKTASYSDIAKLIGRPRAYRAVGSAIKRNPFPVIIPCHRVIKKNKELGNYTFKGENNPNKKKKLLIKEGANR